MKTAITDLLNIKYPIFQGAMAWVADESLASAVSNAGGLGIIGTGFDSSETVDKKIQAMKSLTTKPFAINIMLLSPNVDEVVECILKSGIKVITTGAGNPAKYMPAFKKAGIKVIPVVASVAYAKKMEQIGADAIVVEGMEAGGHIGKITSMALIPQVTSTIKIPVIAAGGFGDGRGLAAALMLGASGIQVGTRFVVADESNAHDNFKNKIIKSSDIDTVITGQITGHPVRVLRNKLTKEYLLAEKEETSKTTPDLERLELIGKGALRRAVVEGDLDKGSFMAGQISGLINKRESCAEIIQSYVEECECIISNSYNKILNND